MRRDLTLLYAWLYAWLHRQITGSYPPGTPMTDGGKLDLNDAFISPLFVISAAVDAKLVDFTIWGFDFANPLMSFSDGAAISTATVFSLLSLVIAYLTNRPDFSAMGVIQTWVAVATVALVIVPPFMPILDGILSVSIVGLIAVVIQASGFYTLAYLG